MKQVFYCILLLHLIPFNESSLEVKIQVISKLFNYVNYVKFKGLRY